MPDGSIRVAEATEDSLGTYTCVPYNALGTMGMSPPATLVLKVHGCSCLLVSAVEFLYVLSQSDLPTCEHDMGLCVFIKDPPYFNVRPGGEYRQEAGRELVIPCAASGDPDIPTITWRKVQWTNAHKVYCVCLDLTNCVLKCVFVPSFSTTEGGEAKPE